ncbi:MAG: sigma-70 family RNA polymerase sigma factor [Flavobacteriaceae bacterium]|jgi:RNA polymerase sigma-70 factor (ECF subfamily)|nr:sigma-70 family RNA polymerase sigma factor [Flavobacteriaceae bacterium]
MTQEDIVLMIRSKDQKAFIQLYDLYAQSLYGIISGLTSDSEEAENILHDVFVKIWNNFDSFPENKVRFYTWIANLARETAIEKQKSDENYSKNKHVSKNFINLIDEKKIDTIGIEEFVKKMKPLHIKLIDTLFFKGHTPIEVSEEFDIPISTIRSENRNSIAELKKLISEL